MHFGVVLKRVANWLLQDANLTNSTTRIPTVDFPRQCVRVCVI